ncbi:hypothetical protein D3C87_80710 [compost metagenome]
MNFEVNKSKVHEFLNSFIVNVFLANDVELNFIKIKEDVNLCHWKISHYFRRNQDPILYEIVIYNIYINDNNIIINVINGEDGYSICYDGAINFITNTIEKSLIELRLKKYLW